MPRRKSKQQTNQPAQLGQILSLLQQMAVSAPAKKRKRRKRKTGGGSVSTMNSDGTVRLSRSEFVSTISIPSGARSVTGHIDLLPDSFPFLKSVFRSFDQYRFEKLQVYYKPVVGTTTGGAVAFGMDWDWASTDVLRVNISSFTPNCSTAAWQDTESRPLILPLSRLQTRAWYMPRATEYVDKGPGKIHFAADGPASTTLGELWVRYQVVMAGTNPA